MKKIKYSEITPENIYKNRRKFIKKFGLAALIIPFFAYLKKGLLYGKKNITQIIKVIG